MIAILLALLFRFFEAEAYVIPTGSMAPNLQGRHVDLVCPQCEYEYRGGASDRHDNSGSKVRRAACPICQFPHTLNTAGRRDHLPFSGDRVLVNKFAYDFWDPERFDVIVFKYPNVGKQNFIKRVLGLPSEGVLIECGDLYTYMHATESFADRKIARKSPQKLLAMLQMVDDTNHIPEKLLAAGWPSRWQSPAKNGPEWSVSDSYKEFTLQNDSDSTAWLRYRHLRPRIEDWDRLDMSEPEMPRDFASGRAAGELITDHYAYNQVTPTVRRQGQDLILVDEFDQRIGMHWVGDLAVEADLELLNEKGKLLIEVVEGGAHFRCSINIADGTGTFSVAGDKEIVTQVQFTGEAGFSTKISGSGKHKVLFANADDKLFLYVDGKIAAECEYDRIGNVTPKYSESDPGDAQPLGIGGNSGLNVKVSRLKVMRDIYYVSRNLHADGIKDISSEYHRPVSTMAIKQMLQAPSMWQTSTAMGIFDSRKRDERFVFKLEPNQFFPMGDNSPESQDARIWPGKPFVDGSYMLGEALFIYWPHAKTKPIPFWPNFGRMKFIR